MRNVLRLQKFLNHSFGQTLTHLASLGGQRVFRSNLRRFDYAVRHSRGQPIFWGGAEAFSEVEKMRLFSPRLRHKYDPYYSWHAIRPIHERFIEKAWEKTPLQWMSYLDLNFRLPELLLMRVDKMSMGVSLEGRVPFLDHKLVELAMSIPENVKIRNGT